MKDPTKTRDPQVNLTPDMVCRVVFVFQYSGVLERVSHEKVKWQREKCHGTDVPAVFDSEGMIYVA